jgi:hypothetical protein
MPKPTTPAAVAVQSETTPRLIPVPDWNQYHAWPPAGGMRWLIFNAQSNGFERAFVRVGRRVLVNEAEFFAAVAAQNAKAPKPATGPKPRRVPILDAA